MNIELRSVKTSEIEQVVKVHIDAFAGFFLTSLGKHFLMTYYKSITNHPDGLVLGCFDNDELLGFCAATKLSKGFNSSLVKRNLPAFLWEGCRLFFTRPAALIRLFENFTKTDNNLSDKGEYCELLSICVSRNAQGQGISKILLSQLESTLKNDGQKRLSLTTDYYNNEKAINLYKSSGYSVMYEFITFPDRKMYRFIKNL